MKIFICSNENQLISAKVAKNSIIKRSQFTSNDIEIVHESEVDGFDSFFKKPYLRKGRMINFDKSDMQSFTLLRFHIPALMNFEGTALVIDPDIFLINPGIEDLRALDLTKNAIFARKGLKKTTWASSVMLLACDKLRHWSLENYIDKLHQGLIDYDDLISLKLETESIGELQPCWNEFDTITSSTILLHTTEKLTQPWRVGMRLNSSIPPLFKFLPRAPIYKLFGRDLTMGVDHPERAVTEFFFKELEYCISNNYITENELDYAIEKNYIRQDIRDQLSI